MKFSDYEFFPGVVTDVADPKYVGRVKATVPTIFDSSMNTDGLPWIYPFTMFGWHQGFAKVREGAKIWVFRNINNHNEFWYVPMFELTDSTKGLIEGDNYEDANVLISRDIQGSSVYVYYNSSDGIMIKYGDDNLVNITPNGELIAQAGSGKVVIKNNHVYVGDGEKGEKAVLGETLKSILSGFFNDVVSSAPAAAPPIAGSAPYAAKISAAATAANARLNSMLCTNTNVD